MFLAQAVQERRGGWALVTYRVEFVRGSPAWAFHTQSRPRFFSARGRGGAVISARTQLARERNKNVPTMDVTHGDPVSYRQAVRLTGVENPSAAMTRLIQMLVDGHETSAGLSNHVRQRPPRPKKDPPTRAERLAARAAVCRLRAAECARKAASWTRRAAKYAAEAVRESRKAKK